MKRYYLLRNPETLEVFVSLELEMPPENSVEYFDCEFKKPVFDKYPNPNTVVEGITEQELKLRKLAQTNAICERYETRIDTLVRAHCQRQQFEGIEIPEAIIEQRNDLIKQCRSEIAQLEKSDKEREK